MTACEYASNASSSGSCSDTNVRSISFEGTSCAKVCDVLEIGAVDYHTAGEPFRIVTGQELRGDTILAKRRDAAERLDHLRKLLVNEPRGHADMYGCFVTEPEDDGADLGVVFFHNAGYSTACGHGTIALVTWALESGALPVTGDETRVVVDVPPAGWRRSRVLRRRRRLRALPQRAVLRLGNRRLARCRRRVRRRVLRVGRGARGAGRAAAADRARAGAEARARSGHEIVHPDEPELRDVYGVIFWQREGPHTQRNVTVFADGEVDRSPCGSGTSARLALLDASGELPRGEELRHLSIVGSEFRGRVVDDTDVAGKPAVVTEVEGSAHRTGEHHFVLEDGDELGTGFLLR